MSAMFSRLLAKMENPESAGGVFIISFFAIMLIIGYWVTWPVESFPDKWYFLCWLRVGLMLLSFSLFGLYIGALTLSHFAKGLIPAVLAALLLCTNPMRDIFAGEQEGTIETIEFYSRSFFTSSARYNFATYKKKFANLKFSNGRELEVEYSEFASWRDGCRQGGKSADRATYLAGLERLLSVACAGEGTPKDVDDLATWVTHCDEENDSVSCYRAGRALAKGIGTGKNVRKAAHYYARACDLGFSETCGISP